MTQWSFDVPYFTWHGKAYYLLSVLEVIIDKNINQNFPVLNRPVDECMEVVHEILCRLVCVSINFVIYYKETS